MRANIHIQPEVNNFDFDQLSKKAESGLDTIQNPNEFMGQLTDDQIGSVDILMIILVILVIIIAIVLYRVYRKRQLKKVFDIKEGLTLNRHQNRNTEPEPEDQGELEPIYEEVDERGIPTPRTATPVPRAIAPSVPNKITLTMCLLCLTVPLIEA